MLKHILNIFINPQHTLIVRREKKKTRKEDGQVRLSVLWVNLKFVLAWKTLVLFPAEKWSSKHVPKGERKFFFRCCFFWWVELVEFEGQNNDRRHMFRAMFIGWKITFFSGGTFPESFFLLLLFSRKEFG